MSLFFFSFFLSPQRGHLPISFFSLRGGTFLFFFFFSRLYFLGLFPLETYRKFRLRLFGSPNQLLLGLVLYLLGVYIMQEGHLPYENLVHSDNLRTLSIHHLLLLLFYFFADFSSVLLDIASKRITVAVVFPSIGCLSGYSILLLH